MTVDLYYAPVSMPSRTVVMVASLAGLKLNLHEINLLEGQQKTPEFKKINPDQKVPFMVDGDLKIGESRAIAAYLVNKYLPDDNTLYPRDPVKRARIDEALWFDGGTLFQTMYQLFRPVIFGGKLDDEKLQAHREVLMKLSDRIEASKGKYLLGDDITIADVSIAANLTMNEACDIDMSEFKVVTAYVDRLKQGIPKYHEINDHVIEIMKNFVKTNQAKNS